MFVMAIVLVIASSGLLSLSGTAARSDAMVNDEQQASTVLSQVSRDIRSAHQVSFAGFASPVPTQEIELQMNQPANTWIEWVYTPLAASVNGISQPANSLARYVATAAAGPFKLSAPSVTTPVNVANGTGTPVFRYFQGNGSEITQIVSPSSLQTCTTRVSVEMVVSTQKRLPAVSTFQITDDVAITDQEAQWGTLPCS
jgi:type II secretory pathway pseudopilin PulG